MPVRCSVKTGTNTHKRDSLSKDSQIIKLMETTAPEKNSTDDFYGFYLNPYFLKYSGEILFYL